MDVIPFAAAMLLIGAAELGDKTQLLTFGFATRYPIWEVIAAVFCATGILTVLAVVFGSFISYYFPTFYLQLLSGIVFVIFGLWTLWGKEEEAGEIKSNDSRSPFWLVFTAFFIAELGDKTQLATMALSAKYGAPFQVWLGATLGMGGINALGAFIGKWLKGSIPENWTKWLGGSVFIVFGLVTLVALVVK